MAPHPPTTEPSRIARLMIDELDAAPMVRRSGKVVEVIGTLMRVTGLDAQLGELCNVRDTHGAVLQRAADPLDVLCELGE